MNGRAARGIRKLAADVPEPAERYAPRKARREIVGFKNGPVFAVKLLPIRMLPSSRHLAKQLKRQYNARANKRLPVGFNPRQGW